MNGSSWLLGGGYSWHSGDPAAAQPAQGPSAVVANATLGLSLSTLPNGPLGLSSADDSLGRLALPRGVAVDGDAVLVLSTDGGRVLRYDSVRATLVPLAEVGAQGLGPRANDAAFLAPRRFRGAANIAASGGALYIADPAARRVQVFDLATLALIRLHEGIDEPVDVAAGRGGVYILGRAAGRVFLASPSRDSLEILVDAPSIRGRCDRIAIDRSGKIYLRDRLSQPALHVFTPSRTEAATHPSELITNTAEVRDRFDAPEIHLDSRGEIVLPEALLDPCGLRGTPDPNTRAWRIDDRFVAIDTRNRVVRVHLVDGRLRHRFGPYDAQGWDVAADAADAWSPVDVAASNGCVLILDERHQRIYALQPGAELLRTSFDAPADFERTWRRLADDGAGCLLLWDGVNDVVDRVDPSGGVLGQVTLRQVRQRFDRPAQGTRPVEPPAPVRLTRDGAVPRPPRERPPYPVAAFLTEGTWTSRWLDSELYNCQWHVLELSISALPPGSRIQVRTRTSHDAQSDEEVLASLGTVSALGSWRDTPALNGPPQPGAMESRPRSVDVLVPSGPGQYLQLQIALAGSGITTPVIESVRIRFPRESLLQYLPAIYSKPEEQREFLDRFLSIMQTTWSGIEHDVETFVRYLDPDSVPADGMGWLAGWLALTLEGSWSAEQNRRLLQAMPALRTKWGTAAGLSAWLRVYLSNLGRVDVDELERASIPGIVESFVDRRRLMLSRPGAATLGAGDGLWSPSVERRFQLDVFDREGEIELVSTGSPETDLFRDYAHSFRVYVPASFVRTPDDEALIRRAIELQKPAHTTYELVLVEPRFRVGEQSTIGLDTVIGAPMPGPLLCAAVVDAPGRPPYQRLGFDTTLGCGCGDAGEGGLEGSLG